MDIFKEQFYMLNELDKLERLMPTYSDLLNKLSKAIRRYVWDVSDENRLAVFLNRANWIIGIGIDAIGEDFYWVDMYADLLIKKSDLFSTYDVENAFLELKREIGILKSKRTIQELWEQINPNLATKYSADEMIKKNILESFDEIYTECIAKHPESFFVILHDITHLCRGRKGKREKVENCFPRLLMLQKQKIL